jgi:hypothetical protein
MNQRKFINLVLLGRIRSDRGNDVVHLYWRCVSKILDLGPLVTPDSFAQL